MKPYLSERPRIDLPALAKGKAAVLSCFVSLKDTRIKPPPATPETVNGKTAGSVVENAAPEAAGEGEGGPRVDCERDEEGRISRIIVTSSSGERIAIECRYGEET
ncbi:hypothetical protein OPIT5_24950 [Opitutaceae bacterium TAV5]|nr:hypothetical protein OPIT5_24950 [Opitutaceae bacterium TAV5]